MIEKEEEEFQASNTCQICTKLIDDEKGMRSLAHNWKGQRRSPMDL